MTAQKRSYTPRTLKILFALSGNQCAHPDCTNSLIEKATENSGTLVTCNVCHIYAISEKGPRGKAGLSEKEKNSHENLILLCRHHHAIIDGQHETYPAQLLKSWKQLHENKMQLFHTMNFTNSYSESLLYPNNTRELIDRKLQEEIDILRKSRYFAEFDRNGASLILAGKIHGGDWSGGTSITRCRALAWCARLLSASEEISKAEEYLKIASSLGSCDEVKIARAFVCSAKGKKGDALRILADIDSQMARTAAILIIAAHDGSEEAVAWIGKTNIEISNLDSEGKYVVMTHLLSIFRWSDAIEVLEFISEEDLEAVPIFNYVIGIILLLIAVPVEYRSIVSNQVPVNSYKFPLSDNSEALNFRRKSIEHFVKSTEIAKEYNCPKLEKISYEYALWLKLRDPISFEEGMKQLKDKLRDSKYHLRLVPLGFEFGLCMDVEAIEKKIEQETAHYGEITNDAAMARFALAFTQKTPELVANYLDLHYKELAIHLNTKSLKSLQIEMLARAGKPESAIEALTVLLEEGLSTEEENRLRRMISESEGADPLEIRKAQYRQTESLSDLRLLVNELESREEWHNLVDFGKMLFAEENSLRSAEQYVRALFEMHKTKEIIVFVRNNIDIMVQSSTLKMCYCWSLYQEGEVLQARTELEKYGDNDQNHRMLLVKIGIALGDWHSLLGFVANEYKNKDKRTARDLLKAADLAFNIGSPNSKELLFAAVEKANENPSIFAEAYFLASNAGFEDISAVSEWISKAVELSGEEGPVKQMSLGEVLDRKPDWDRQESEIFRLLRCGEIPLFIAAQSLNASIISMTLFPAFMNQKEIDLRRRKHIPAFSGMRQIVDCDFAGTIGIGATTLVTLGFLSLLEIVFTTLDEICVPHSIFRWLFEEKKKVAYHQPSRIREANKVRDLQARNLLEVLEPSVLVDSELSQQVGEELATLVAEAESLSCDTDVQCIVIRPYPVQRFSSLMEEEADLKEHYAVLSSCIAVVHKLKQKGKITIEEDSKACAYLGYQEKLWPNQPEIIDGATLFLDELAVNYFLHLGLLEKLSDAGFKLVISQRTFSTGTELISYSRFSDDAEKVIENIRTVINDGVASGKVKFGKQQFNDMLKETWIADHPTVALFELAKNCNAIITDDRFTNKDQFYSDASSRTPILTTLDLIDWLVSTGILSTADQIENITKLRRAGYLFIPVTEDELVSQLTISKILDGKVNETAELKAIRESILHVRMSDWLQIPQEAYWLNSILGVFVRVLKGIWEEENEISTLEARSNWILEQINICGWAHLFKDEARENIIKYGYAKHIFRILLPPTNVSAEIKRAYFAWVEKTFLDSFKRGDPNLYKQVADLYKERIVDTTPKGDEQEETT